MHTFAVNRQAPAVEAIPFEPAHPQLLAMVIAIARDAGAAIMPFFQNGAEVRTKQDSSPVTAADEAADALITRALCKLTPTIQVVSEESAQQFNGQAPGSVFWLVDPLDGTREFIAGRDEFTVNIALVQEGTPMLGVVFLPARNELYAGSNGRGATMITNSGLASVRCRTAPAEGSIIAVSRSHGDIVAESALLAGSKVAGQVQAGSSLKFCLVARGDADLYPRAGRTMEWDTAAGQAVLEAAGGSVVDTNGTSLRYGKAGLENSAFVARGSTSKRLAGT